LAGKAAARDVTYGPFWQAISAHLPRVVHTGPGCRNTASDLLGIGHDVDNRKESPDPDFGFSVSW
jgi:hypothetical protein